MSRIDPAHTTPPNLVELCRHQRFESSDGAKAPAPSSPRGADRVEISDRARWMSQLQKLPSVREEMVNRIRALVNDGTYDVAGKLDTALDRMIDEWPIDNTVKRLSA